MKVFLDANVLLSTFFGTGLCAELMQRLIVSPHEIVIGEPVVSEFSRIALNELKAPERAVSSAMEVMERLTPASAVDVQLEGIPDPDDAPIIACALAAGCDLFVTGDKALLASLAVENMPIVAPREAWVHLFDA